MVPDKLIWTVNWLHYLNYEAIPRSSSTCNYFVLGTSYVRLSHSMDGAMAFHVSFLSLDCSQSDLSLTVFLTKGNRVFHVLILSLIVSGDGYASGRLSYGQASTYPLSYVLRYCFCICVSVRMYKN